MDTKKDIGKENSENDIGVNKSNASTERAGPAQPRFGTAGIRGDFAHLTPELAFKIGNCFAQHIPEGKKAFVAKDARITGDVLATALISGILTAGHDVVYLGIAPTPTAELYLHSKADEAGMLFVITASHNPAPDNGIKIFKGDGMEFDEKEGNAIFSECNQKAAEWQSVGKMSLADPLPTYIDEMARFLGPIEAVVIGAQKEQNRDKVSEGTDVGVLFDLGGGTTVLTAKPLLKRILKLPYAFLFDELDPFFSSRPSEPSRQNLSALMAALKKKAEQEGKDYVGFAFDGDGDRASLLSAKYGFLGGDYVFALALAELYERGYKGDVCTTVATTQLIDDVARHYSFSVRRTRVGSPFILQCLKKREKAMFGGENIGGIVFKKLSYAKDGLLSAALALSYIVKRKKVASSPGSSAEPINGLDAFMQAYPRYYGIYDKVRLTALSSASSSSTTSSASSSASSSLLENVFDKLKEAFSSYRPEINAMDGLRMDFPEKHTWLLVRQSGTEPSLLRIVVEARDEQWANELAEKVKAHIKEAVE